MPSDDAATPSVLLFATRGHPDGSPTALLPTVLRPTRHRAVDLIESLAANCVRSAPTTSPSSPGRAGPTSLRAPGFTVRRERRRRCRPRGRRGRRGHMQTGLRRARGRGSRRPRVRAVTDRRRYGYAKPSPRSRQAQHVPVQPIMRQRDQVISVGDALPRGHRPERRLRRGSMAVGAEGSRRARGRLRRTARRSRSTVGVTSRPRRRVRRHRAPCCSRWCAPGAGVGVRRRQLICARVEYARHRARRRRRGGPHATAAARRRRRAAGPRCMPGSRRTKSSWRRTWSSRTRRSWSRSSRSTASRPTASPGSRSRSGRGRGGRSRPAAGSPTSSARCCSTSASSSTAATGSWPGATGQFSRYGGWLDMIGDRAKEYIVFAGLAIGGVRTHQTGMWGLALAAIVLQTMRHMVDTWYGALQETATRSLPVVPLDCPTDTLGLRAGHAAGTTGVGATLGRLSAAAHGQYRSPPYYLKRSVVLPIGDRWLLIALTAAIFGPKITFIVLLAAAALAFAYVFAGRTLRALAMRIVGRAAVRHHRAARRRTDRPGHRCRRPGQGAAGADRATGDGGRAGRPRRTHLRPPVEPPHLGRRRARRSLALASGSAPGPSTTGRSTGCSRPRSGPRSTRSSSRPASTVAPHFRSCTRCSACS